MILKPCVNKKLIEVVAESPTEFHVIKSQLIFKKRSFKYKKIKGAYNGNVNFLIKERFVPIQLWQYLYTLSKKFKLKFNYDQIKHLIVENVDEKKVEEIYRRAISTRTDIEFDQDQLDSIILMIRHNYCKANLSVSYGKSLVYFVVSAYLMIEKNDKIILITPKPTLNVQLFAEFMSFSTKIPELAGRMMYTSSGSDIYSYSQYDLIITNFQYAWDKPDDFFEKFNTAIIDEVHRAVSKSYKIILNKCSNIKRTKGGTGTLLSDESVETMSMLVASGFTIKVVKKREIINNGRATDGVIEVHMIRTLTPEQVYMLTSYHNEELDPLNRLNKELAMIRTSKQRVDYIVKIAGEKIEESSGGNGLIFFKDVKNRYGRNIADELQYRYRNLSIFYIDQNVSDSIRSEIYNYARTNKNCIIVVSYDIASTGLSINTLFWGIGAEPTKSVTTIGQFLGRFMRKDVEKDRFTYCDIVDDITIGNGKKGFLFNWFKYNRLPVYEADDFKIEYKTANINNQNW